MSADRQFLQSLAFGVAIIVVSPSLASFDIRARVRGRDRALAGSTPALALVALPPAGVGQAR